MKEVVTPTTPKAIKIAAAVGAVLLIAFFAFIFWVFWTTPDRVDEATKPEPATSPVIEEPKPVTPQELPQTGSPVIPVSRMAPVEEPLEVTVAPEPKEIPRTNDMTAAGIPASDQAIAAALLLNADGTWSDAPAPGRRLALSGNSPVERFALAHNYALVQYGSWGAAQAHANANGGRW